jgi:hypothetical protein
VDEQGLQQGVHPGVCEAQTGDAGAGIGDDRGGQFGEGSPVSGRGHQVGRTRLLKQPNQCCVVSGEVGGDVHAPTMPRALRSASELLAVAGYEGTRRDRARPPGHSSEAAPTSPIRQLLVSCQDAIRPVGLSSYERNGYFDCRTPCKKVLL